MATADMTEGDRADGMLSPSEEDPPPLLNDDSGPLNFSELTPRAFGISVKSFTPVSLSNCKDKSRLAQIKSRRKSSIGSRGSPETNSLIRFIAQQRMKTASAFQTPELVRSSPFLPRVASTLRQKMASFQSLMDVEESGVCEPMPRQDSNTGGCIKTRDYLSDRNSHYGGKENHPPTMTPMPSKRGRLGLIEGCEVEIREAGAPILHEEDEEAAVMQVVTQGSLPSSEPVEEEEDHAVLMTPNLHTDLALRTCSPAKDEQGDLFELERLGRPPPDDSAAAPPARAAPLFHSPTFPSLLEMKPAGEDDCAVQKKKKSVRFGGPLSPEFFDKHLPPSTPLQKGGTPGRAATPRGSFQPRSVLKTPQRSEPRTTSTQAQPDLSGLAVFGASPTLAMPRNRSVASAGESGKEGERTIVFPLMEEIDSAATADTECTWETQPVNLNAAFHEEFLSRILTESETIPGTICPVDSLDEPAPSLEREKHPEAAVEAPAPTRSRSQRKKHPGPEHAARREAPAGCTSRKRKLPEESEPVKRSTRSAAKTASGRIKTNSVATRRWNKDVDRSLYGSRAYASKNPNLSPITERLPLLGQSQAAQKIPSPNHETGSNLQMPDDPPATDDLPATNALENLSHDAVTSPNCSNKETLRKGRRLSGPRVKRRGAKKRRVAVVNEAAHWEESLDQAGRNTEEELCEEQTTAGLDPSSGTPLTRSEPEGGTVATGDDAVTSAETLAADCPASGGESDDTLSRSARRTPPEQETRAEAQQGDIRLSPGGQEGTGVADFPLAPWQADFNFDDVFKPVAARRQRSVRRSLRNRRGAREQGGDGSSFDSTVGLAWLAWTSPDSNKESRRKTRGRRPSAAPPVPQALPEGNAAS